MSPLAKTPERATTQLETVPNPAAEAEKSLRELAEEALHQESRAGYAGPGSKREAEEARSLLWSALDAQEAALRRARELAEGWKIEAYAWAVGIDMSGNNLDKAYSACARELEDALDGIAPAAPEPEEAVTVPHGSVIPYGVSGS